MGLTLTGTDQWLDTGVVAVPQQPLTFFGWIRRNLGASHSLISGGIPSTDESFQNIQVHYEIPRALSFMPLMTAGNGATYDYAAYHSVMGVYTGTQIILYFDDDAAVASAWSPQSNTLLQFAIGGRSVSNNRGMDGFVNGVLAHCAIWDAALTAGDYAVLRARSANPMSVATANIRAYFPFQGDLSDFAGDYAWTAHNLASPTYETDGINYPALGPQTVTYAANSNTGGAVPNDTNSPYDENETVTVLTNSGNLVRTGYNFIGWNTNASGTGTHYNESATFTMGSAPVILYAEWEIIGTLSVTYHNTGSTGGSVPVDARLYAPGALVTVLANPNNLVRTGYNLVGWKNTP